MADQKPTEQQRAYTSESTRRLTSHAEVLLSSSSDPEQMMKAIEKIADSVDQLSDEERKQLEELTRLFHLDEDNAQMAETLSQDAAFRFDVSGDKMSITLSIRPAVGNGHVLTQDDIINELRQMNVGPGILIDELKETIDQAAAGESVESVLVVQGRGPSESTADTLALFARHKSDDDLHQIDLELEKEAIQTGRLLCKEGDVILMRVPGREGEPGFDALNHPLPADPPATVEFSVGPNVKQVEDQAVAAVAGVVVFDGNHIEVRQVLVIDQDVTANDDPIDFDGEVSIRAAVRMGARVRASGNISVDGSVEGAHIESTGGDIRLRHGVAGHNEAMIKAEGDINARFAENATLMAGRSIVIDIGSMHSRLIAGKSIHMIRGRGQVIGGSTMAGDLIEVKQAGATSGVPTLIHVGLSREVMEQLGMFDEEIAKVQVQREQACELADKMARTVGDPTTLTAEERKAYTRLRQVQLVSDVKIREIRSRRDEVLADSARLTGGRIDITGKMMPQVQIRIGDADLVNDMPRQHCRIRYQDATGKLVMDGVR